MPSTALPPRSPLSLVLTEDAQMHRPGTCMRGRQTLKKTKNKQSLTGKFYVLTLLLTHARATRRTSPSQPEDKGAVVARQQVFFWHPRTRRQPALLRSLSDCLPHPRVIRPVLLQKTEEEGRLCAQVRGGRGRTGSGNRSNDLLRRGQCRWRLLHVDLEPGCSGEPNTKVHI